MQMIIPKLDGTPSFSVPYVVGYSLYHEKNDVLA